MFRKSLIAAAVVSVAAVSAASADEFHIGAGIESLDYVNNSGLYLNGGAQFEDLVAGQADLVAEGRGRFHSAGNYSITILSADVGPRFGFDIEPEYNAYGQLTASFSTVMSDLSNDSVTNFGLGYEGGLQGDLDVVTYEAGIFGNTAGQANDNGIKLAVYNGEPINDLIVGGTLTSGNGYTAFGVDVKL